MNFLRSLAHGPKTCMNLYVSIQIHSYIYKRKHTDIAFNKWVPGIVGTADLHSAGQTLLRTDAAISSPATRNSNRISETLEAGCYCHWTVEAALTPWSAMAICYVERLLIQ